jgi:hypothetical protein
VKDLTKTKLMHVLLIASLFAFALACLHHGHGGIGMSSGGGF